MTSLPERWTELAARGPSVVIALGVCIAVGFGLTRLGTPSSVVVTPTALPVIAAATVEPATPTPPAATATPAHPPPPTATAAAAPPASPLAVAMSTPVPDPTAPPFPTAASARPAPPAEAEDPAGWAVEKGSSGRMEIALTFDAGADRGNGDLILDRLADYGVIASFGITGQWAEANPDLVRRMVDEGHMVFNHSWSHRSWTGRSTSPDPEDRATWQPLSSAERIEELTRTARTIRDLVGYEVAPYWRPAYGDYDQQSLADAAAAGHPVAVMWSCESFAWKGWTAPDIVYHCTTNMAAGDIILLHVGAQGADYEALPGLIEGLREQGFSFVTVEQILQP